MEGWITIFIPIMAVFGIIGWVMFFLETYRHFPKMDSSQRMALSLTNATVMLGMFIVIVYAFMYYYFGVILNPVS